MNRMNHRSLVILLLFVVLCLSAFAQITPSQDAYTNTASPTTNFGTAATLGVVSSATSIQTTYIRFDLSSVPAGYTSTNVAKATLKVFVSSVAKAGSFNVDFVNGSWSEKTITANLAPALGSTIASSVPLATANANEYVLIDVTTAVGDWLNGSQAARHTALTNLGLTGVDPFTLQRAAGHASITTTRKYVHPTPPTMKDAFQKKVRNEQRDRRAARKRVARATTIPPMKHQATPGAIQ